MHQKIAEINLARENLMLDRLCAEVKAFYEKPENVKAFKAWKKNKEDNHENNNNNGLNRGKSE